MKKLLSILFSSLLLITSVLTTNPIVADEINTINTEDETEVLVFDHEYTINYVLNGGTNDEDNITSFTYDELSDEYFSLKDATKAGCTFDGWFTKDGSGDDWGDQVTKINYNVKGNVTLYAKFTVCPVSLSFKTFHEDDGVTCEPIGVTPGSTYSGLPTPQFDNYDFAGWFLNYDEQTGIYSDEIEDGDVVTINENSIVYAKWEAKTYSLAFETFGGTSLDPIEVTYASKYENLPTPTKDGKKFAGWFLNYDEQTGVYSDEIKDGDVVTIGNNSSVYAKWVEPYTYSINYELLCDDAENPNVVTGFDTGSYKLVNPTRIGYTFKGWYTLDGTLTNKWGSKLTSLSSKNADENNEITVYAKWEINTYKLAYNVNGGKDVNKALPKSIQYTYTDEVKVSDVKPTKVGYTFLGWSLDKKATEATYVGNDDITGINETYKSGATITLYAVYKENKYTVKFVYDGIVEPKTVELLYSQSHKINNAIFDEVKGKTVGKWSYDTGKLDKKGNPVYKTISGNASIKSLCTGDEGNKEITLFVAKTKDKKTGVETEQWNLTKYKVTYVLNGGKNNTKVNKSSYTVDSGIVFDKATRVETINKVKVDVEFEGWYDNPNYEGTPVTSTEGLFENITLYAAYKDKKQNIKYHNIDGVDNSGNPSVYMEGGSVKFVNLVKPGYKFNGWYDELLKKKVSIGAKTVGEVDAYAKFTANKYTISFNANGGKGSMAKVTFVYADDSLEKLPTSAFTKVGYVLTGFNTDKNGTGTHYDKDELIKNICAGQTKTSVTLYAEWSSDTLDAVDSRFNVLDNSDEHIAEIYNEMQEVVDDNKDEDKQYTVEIIYGYGGKAGTKKAVDVILNPTTTAYSYKGHTPAGGYKDGPSEVNNNQFSQAQFKENIGNFDICYGNEKITLVHTAGAAKTYYVYADASGKLSQGTSATATDKTTIICVAKDSNGIFFRFFNVLDDLTIIEHYERTLTVNNISSLSTNGYYYDIAVNDGVGVITLPNIGSYATGYEVTIGKDATKNYKSIDFLYANKYNYHIAEEDLDKTFYLTKNTTDPFESEKADDFVSTSGTPIKYDGANGKIVIYELASNMSLTYNYEVNVTFNPNGGTFTSDSTTVNKVIETVDHKVSMPEVARTNYVFAGWLDASENICDEDTIFNEGVTLTAKWNDAAVEYKDVKFIVDDETIKTIQVVKGSKISSSLIPTIEDETRIFDAWYIGDTLVDFDNYVVNEDVELIGKFKPNRTLTINGLGYQYTSASNPPAYVSCSTWASLTGGRIDTNKCIGVTKGDFENTAGMALNAYTMLQYVDSISIKFGDATAVNIPASDMRTTYFVDKDNVLAQRTNYVAGDKLKIAIGTSTTNTINTRFYEIKEDVDISFNINNVNRTISYDDPDGVCGSLSLNDKTTNTVLTESELDDVKTITIPTGELFGHDIADNQNDESVQLGFAAKDDMKAIKVEGIVGGEKQVVVFSKEQTSLVDTTFGNIKFATSKGNIFLRVFRLDYDITVTPVPYDPTPETRYSLNKDNSIDLLLGLSTYKTQNIDPEKAYITVNSDKILFKDLLCDKDSLGNVRYNFNLSNYIGAKQIADEYTVTFYSDEDIKLVEDPMVISAKAIIDSMPEELNAYGKAVENYGLLAQKVLNYKAGELVLPELTKVTKDDDYNAILVGETEGVEAYGQSLVLGYYPTSRVYFDVNGSIGDYTFKVDDVIVTPIKNGDYYVVDIKTSNHLELAQSHVVTVSKSGEGNLSVTVSVLSAANIMLSKKAEGTDYNKLAITLYNLYNEALGIADAYEEVPALDSIDTSNKRLKVAFVGDSITYGYLSSNHKTKSYPAQLSALLNERYDIANFGVSGSCAISDKDPNNLYSKKAKYYKSTVAYNASLEYDADVVVIMLGTNDRTSMYSDEKVLLTEGVNSFEYWLKDLADTYAEQGAKVFIASAIYAPVANEAPKQFFDGILQEYQKKVADDNGYDYIDVYTPTRDVFNDGTYFNSDKLHPNDEGYGYIAAAFDSYFRDSKASPQH